MITEMKAEVVKAQKPILDQELPITKEPSTFTKFSNRVLGLPDRSDSSVSPLNENLRKQTINKEVIAEVSKPSTS